MNKIQDPFLRIAAVCSVLAPLPLFAADIMTFTGSLPFERTIVAWLSFLLFVPATFGLSYLAMTQGSRLAIVGGSITYVGVMAAAGIQVLNRVWAVLNESGFAQITQLLRANRKLTVVTLSIGIFFPLGLFILAGALYRSGAVTPLIALLLAGGAILFPINHIGALKFGRLVGDVLLIAAFAVIAKRLPSVGNSGLKRVEIVQAQTGSRPFRF